MRCAAALGLASVLALGAGAGAAAAAPAPDIAVWIYGAERWAAERIAAELSRLPAGTRRVYLSVEAGARVLLDDPATAARLGEILDVAHARGLSVEAMALQDPRWIADVPGAERRVRAVLAFNEARRLRGAPGFDGLHFDVEPQTDEAWTCGAGAARAAIVARWHALFDRLARVIRTSVGASFRITASFPWWIGATSDRMPRVAPHAWLGALAEVVLMAYGDPGGPMVGGSAASVLRRLSDARVWRDVPAGRGVRVGLATYEYPDAGALASVMRAVADELGTRAEFRGIAVFAHGHAFDGPLTGTLEGRVHDRRGHGVPGAVVRAAGHSARTSSCGSFRLSGLAPGDVDVAVDAEGFVGHRAVARALGPGRLRQLPVVVLEERR
ncbi:MAG TPA: carboxypeptidase-like regulatory domain-containing protein [Terriglobales bacterium]|nr:carboxypeptidase-like regulatory domain-containing protein [Terriglobales bacterium]